MNTHLTVIIPTFNRCGYLQEALDSVFQQTLVPAEIIVVDDGSTDGTEEVITKASRPVKFLRQEHQGIVAARNLGLRAATSELIAWLDSDDLWEPEFAATTVAALAAHPEWDGVYTGITLIDEGGKGLSQSVRIEPAEFLYDRLVEDCWLATPTIVVRKTCYDRVGGFDPRFRVSEDYDMWLRLSSQYVLVGIPEPLARIRIHSQNTMSNGEALSQARLTLVAKHFGALTARIDDMPESTRRAYGYAYRAVGTRYLEGGAREQGWEYLRQGARIHPPILTKLDTFYELALGDQSRGYRGNAKQLDLDTRAAEMLSGLEALFASAGEPVKAQHGLAFGNAHLALAMLYEQAGSWAAARRHIFQAIRSHPRLAASPGVLRRTLKLCAGRKATSSAKKFLAALRHDPSLTTPSPKA